MPVFEYRGLSAEGKTVTGVIDAESPKVARAKLRRTGVFPIEVVQPAAQAPSEIPTPAKGGVFRLGSGVRRAEIAGFTRQLSTLISAGLPLMEVLSALLEQAENTELRKVLGAIRESVRGGASLADALEGFPREFSDLYRQMVRAGEASGTLDAILLRLADYLDNQLRLRNRVLSTLAYPLLMLLVSLSILVFLIAFVIPKVTTVFTGLGRALPLPTRLLIGLSDAIRFWGWLAIPAVAAAGWWIRKKITTPQGRERFDRRLLNLPLVGRLFKMTAVARFARTLATLLASGIPLLSAVKIARDVVGNRALARALDESAAAIREGESVAEPLRRSGLFPPLLTHMIAVGEASGELEGMLSKVAEAYDAEVETVVSTLTSLLGPVIILFMGVVVLFIVLAILLPIFEISQIVR